MGMLGSVGSLGEFAVVESRSEATPTGMREDFITYNVRALLHIALFGTDSERNWLKGLLEGVDDLPAKGQLMTFL